MSIPYGTYGVYGTGNRPVVGKARVTFGNLNSAKKYNVSFKSVGNDQYVLTLYKDERYSRPCQEEAFNGSDVCGLDWGTFEKQTILADWCYLPPVSCTYITIITRTRSISLLFPKDEGVQMNYWKSELQDRLFGGGSLIREQLLYEDQTVFLQASKRNISLTCQRDKNEPARMKQCWKSEMFYSCDVDGNYLTLSMKSSLIPSGKYTVQLKCERSGIIYGQFFTQEDILSRIKYFLYDWIVVYAFTQETIYDGLHHIIPKDFGSEYYDLNKLDDTETTEYQVRKTLGQVYRKIKDNDSKYTTTERRTVMIGWLLRQILAAPPKPDTLNLSASVRDEICVGLYTDSLMVRSGDWTSLASEIGIKQAAIRHINGIFLEERPNNYKAEIILRHWQYTYNEYWEEPESEHPDRPRHPCTKEGLIKALQNIRRHDLVRILTNDMQYARSDSVSKSQCGYEKISETEDQYAVIKCSQDNSVKSVTGSYDKCSQGNSVKSVTESYEDTSSTASVTDDHCFSAVTWSQDDYVMPQISTLGTVGEVFV